MQIKNIIYTSDAALTYRLAADERVSPFYDGMFRNNEISGAAAFVSGEDEGGCTLSFDVKGRVPLSKLMQQPMKRSHMLTVLVNIGEIILNAQAFMLEERCFILENDLVFVDAQTMDVTLVFDPTYNKHAYSYRAFAKLWALKGNFDLTEDGLYPTQVIGIVNDMAADIDVSKLLAAFRQLRDTAPQVQEAPKQNASLADKMLGGIKMPARQQPAHKPMPEAPVSGDVADGAPAERIVRLVEPNAPFRVRAQTRAQGTDDNMTVFADSSAVRASVQAQPAAAAAYLVDAAGNRVPVNKAKFHIGKGKATATPNDYIINNAGVSRAHALIEHTDSGYYIIDLYSLNGTFVNGTRLISNEKRRLESGDTVVFANERYTFRID